MPKLTFRDVHDEGSGEQIEAVVMVTPVERQGGMRLNGAMKQQVVEKAIDHAFSKRELALLKEEHALTRLFWLHKFGKAKLAHAKALGEPFVVDCSRDRYGNKAPHGVKVSWRVGGQVVNLYCQMPLNVNTTLEYASGSAKHIATINDEALVARCRIYQNASEKFVGEKTRVANTLAGMLQNISTYTSLEKNWPEGKKFYQHLPKAFPFRHQVPAVLINELNAALGV